MVGAAVLGSDENKNPSDTARLELMSSLRLKCNSKHYLSTKVVSRPVGVLWNTDSKDDLHITNCTSLKKMRVLFVLLKKNESIVRIT